MAQKFSLFLALTLFCIFATGCADTPTEPDQTVKYFLENLPSGDFEKLSEVTVKDFHPQLKEIIEEITTEGKEECGDFSIEVLSVKVASQSDTEAVVVFDATMHCPKTGEDDNSGDQDITLLMEDGRWKIADLF